MPGSTSETYTVSDLHRAWPTLGDLMHRADPRSRVVAIVGKGPRRGDDGAHTPDQLWLGGWRAFVGHAGPPRPAPGTRVNERAAEALVARPRPNGAAGHLRSRAGRRRGGPGRAGRHRPLRQRRRRPRGLRASPEFDALILDLASGLRDEIGFGEGPATDLLASAFTATTMSATPTARRKRMCIQVLARRPALANSSDLDREGRWTMS